MLTHLAWLALEVKSLESARSFYRDTLELPVREQGLDTELVFEAGETDLVCRRPDGIPRGGLHTHFAFSIPTGEYDDWWDTLNAGFDLQEFEFGHAKSLYLYDPAGNCVELGQSECSGSGICDIFEVVLEVESLERAEAFYATLGFETVDRGRDRKRVRMSGPVALELWEPQLGIADARGGVHVDLGFETDDLEGVWRVLEEHVESAADGSGVVVRSGLDANVDADGGTDTGPNPDEIVISDPDGHHVTFRSQNR